MLFLFSFLSPYGLHHIYIIVIIIYMYAYTYVITVFYENKDIHIKGIHNKKKYLKL